MVVPADLVRDARLPRHEAERLLVVASGISKAGLMTVDDLAADVVDRFDDLAAQRRSGVPLQYLEGSVAFGPLELRTDARALIPRPETERLWELVVALIGRDEPAVIVDLCTGSGNLALALQHTYPNAAVFGTDTSADALALAAENATATGLSVTWLHGDLFAPLPDAVRGHVDLVVSNPPYIPAGSFASLPDEVRDHEPFSALIAGPAGDEVLGRIAADAGAWVRPGALIACEIGADQGERARRLFSGFGADIERDLAGRDRFVVARAEVR